MFKIRAFLGSVIDSGALSCHLTLTLSVRSSKHEKEVELVSPHNKHT